MGEQFKNEIITYVRTVLTTQRGPISLTRLEDDYRMLLGEEIPYARLGYENLQSFLTSIPSLITTESPDGQILVEARANNVVRVAPEILRNQRRHGGRIIRFRDRL